MLVVGGLDKGSPMHMDPTSKEDSKEIFEHSQSHPIVSKSNWLHVVIFQFFFTNMRYVP